LFFDSASNQFAPRWLQEGTPAVWTADTTAPNHLSPGSALLFHRRGLPVSLLWTGQVRDSHFRLALRPGTQLVAAGFPGQHSPNSLRLLPDSGLTPGSSPAAADRFRLWLGDAQPGTSGYTAFFLLETPEGARWVNQTDNTSLDASSMKLFPSTRGLFLQRLPDSAPLLVTQEPPSFE
jgi:hypothetical protein